MNALRALFDVAVRDLAGTGRRCFADAVRSAQAQRQLAHDCDARALSAAILQVLSALERELQEDGSGMAVERAWARFEGLLAQHRATRPAPPGGLFAPRAPVFRWPRWLVPEGEH